MALLLAISLVTAILATGEIQVSPSLGESWAPLVALTCIAWLALYVGCTWVHFGSPYLFSSAYIAVLAVFHLGLLIPYSMGIVEVRGWDGEQARWIRKAAWYTALSFATFGIGFATVCLRRRPQRLRLAPEQQAALFRGNLAGLRNLAIGLALAAAVALVIAIARLGNLLAYSRFELFFRSADPRFLSLFFYLAPTAALALVITARTRGQRVFSYITAAAVFVVLMLSGNRSWTFFPLLVGAVLWVKLGRRIPAYVAPALVAGVLLAIPAIGMLRTLGTYEEMSLRDFQKSQEQSRITSALFEMGSTLGVLAVALEHVPEKEPYRYFGPYLIYVKQAIPNFGLEANREYARDSLYRQIMSNPRAVLELEPSDWASWKIIPESFLTGAGTGFSAIGQPYFSFGYLGVVVWFAALGAFLARMDLTDIRLHYNWLVFSALFFWNLLVTCRNSFGVFTKPASLILTVLAIWLLVRRFTPFRRPARREGPQAVTR